MGSGSIRGAWRSDQDDAFEAKQSVKLAGLDSPNPDADGLPATYFATHSRGRPAVATSRRCPTSSATPAVQSSERNPFSSRQNRRTFPNNSSYVMTWMPRA